MCMSWWNTIAHQLYFGRGGKLGENRSINSIFVQWGEGEEFDTDISYLFLACNHCMCSKSRLNHWLSKFFLLHKYAKSIAVGCIKKEVLLAPTWCFLTRNAILCQCFLMKRKLAKRPKTCFEFFSTNQNSWHASNIVFGSYYLGTWGPHGETINQPIRSRGFGCPTL